MPSKSSALAVIFFRTWTVLAGIAVAIPAAAQQPNNQSPGRVRLQSGGAPVQGEPQAQRAAEAPELSPELEEILREWSEQSASIRRLQGRHIRHVFDTTWSTESRTQGMFCYTAPDRGRIDFEGIAVGPKDAPLRPGFKLQAGSSEIWVCDGTRIISLDPTSKTGDAAVIPKSNRGASIMHGPLPFLFGMPPEIAKQRYRITLQKAKTNNERVCLTIVPRWDVDASTYRSAQVLLDRTNYYLPMAVELEDPHGSNSTLYKFSDFKVNPAGFLKLFGLNEDPLSDKAVKKLESGYQLKINEIADAQAEQPAAPQGDPNDPNAQPGPAPAAALKGPPKVIGFEWKKAGELLERAGYIVDYEKGDPAPKPELVYRVQHQKLVPAANPGDKATILVYCYIEMVAENSGNAQQ